MTEEQINRLIEAVEKLTDMIELVSRPPIIVTDDENCDLVMNYRKRGYPIYYLKEPG